MDQNITVENLYRQYCTEGFDENGVLNRFEIHCPDNFNFAYDVLDRFAQLEPQRRAMVWTNTEGEERCFTFRDMSLASNRAANMFRANGIRHGDRVLLVLKRDRKSTRLNSSH